MKYNFITNNGNNFSLNNNPNNNIIYMSTLVNLNNYGILFFSNNIMNINSNTSVNVDIDNNYFNNNIGMNNKLL